MAHISIAKITLDYNSNNDRTSEICWLARSLVDEGWILDETIGKMVIFVYNKDNFIKIIRYIDDDWGYQITELYMTIGNLFINYNMSEFFDNFTFVYQFDRSSDQFTKLFNTHRNNEIKTHREDLIELKGEVRLPSIVKSARN